MESEKKTSTIVWKLPKEQKGRYMAAALASRCNLVAWIEHACEVQLKEDLPDGVPAKQPEKEPQS